MDINKMKFDQPVERCYQCKKCSAGCPISNISDLHTHQVVRLIQLGQITKLLESKRIWQCLSCKTCQSRCPNGIDTSSLIDLLKEIALEKGIAPADARVPAFNRAFLKSVYKHGRLYELGMIGGYKMATATYMDDMALGIKMFMKGKMKLLPGQTKDLGQVQEIFLKSEARKQ